MYIDYKSALEMSGLDTLHVRREERCLNFAIRCVKHPRNSRLFPYKENTLEQDIRKGEIFKVNFARTADYQTSTIPFCQTLLNTYCSRKQVK